MPKNIIFCADGTWNSPNQDENEDHIPDHTNVLKLFYALKGEMSLDTINKNNEQEKSFAEDGEIKQVAKYIHGVGDSNNPLQKFVGGVFGAGIIARIVRGYTFISRNYTNGDNIIIIGFSRGAYTARALAGLICNQGLLDQSFFSATDDTSKMTAYRAGSQAWYAYRSSINKELANVFYTTTDLPAFIFQDNLIVDRLLPVKNIKAIGVWDTVGSLGIPDLFHKEPVDIFKFADLDLNTKVEFGFHAVALDEQRKLFTPTLWNYRTDIEQLLFAGAHSDVGGGYPESESGLSDIALGWMLERLSTCANVLFNPYSLNPNPCAPIHTPWKDLFFSIPRPKRRDFSHAFIQEHQSITERSTCSTH